MPEYPSGKKAGKKWKDISVKHSMFTAFEAMKSKLRTLANPLCLRLNWKFHNSLSMRSSIFPEQSVSFALTQ